MALTSYTFYDGTTGAITGGASNIESTTFTHYDAYYIEGHYPADAYWIDGGVPTLKTELPKPTTTLISTDGIDKTVLSGLPNPTIISIDVDWDGIDDVSFTETSGTFEIFSTVEGTVDVNMKTTSPAYRPYSFTLASIPGACVGRTSVGFTFNPVTIYNSVNVVLDDPGEVLFEFMDAFPATEQIVSVTAASHPYTFNSVTPATMNTAEVNGMTVSIDFNDVIPFGGHYTDLDATSVVFTFNDATPANINEPQIIAVDDGSVVFTFNTVIPSMENSVSHTAGAITVTFNDATPTN